jgi:hypothetical protein
VKRASGRERETCRWKDWSLLISVDLRRMEGPGIHPWWRQGPKPVNNSPGTHPASFKGYWGSPHG